MLTRFFGSTKPIAIVLVLGYMTIGFFYSNKTIFIESFQVVGVLKIIGMWFLYVVAVFVLNFITRKNNLTKVNAYRTLLFAAFGLALPVALRDGSILLAGVFILFSMRRIVSLRSGLHIERKLFDATFWICLASLFYFYSWFFLIAMYLGIILYRNINIRYFFIPFIAISCFLILGYTVLLLIDNGHEFLAIYPESISLDFSAYNNTQVLIAIAFLIGVLFWTLWNYLGEQQRASTSSKARYSVILSLLFVAVMLVIFAPHKTGAEWYFLLPMLSIIVSNYLDKSESIVFKESLLWLIILLPILINIV